MISSEVQRTLVKSPPELWAELSDATSLSRHLGELGGEIRITRSEPEKRVEWEAEGASGSVLIKPSGWGTKVTLSVTREVALPEPEQEEPLLEPVPEPPLEAEAEAEATTEPVLEADDAPAAPGESAAPLAAADGELDEPAAPAIEESPQDEAMLAPVPEPRRGFFARLFARRKPKVTETPELAPESSSEPMLEALPNPDQLPPPPASGSPGSAIESLQARFRAQPAVESVPAAPAALPAPEPPEAEVDPPEPEAIAGLPEADATEAPVEEASEPQIDLAAELKAAEEVAVEEVTALLTGVLDRLGAAHHRPFSRS